MTAMAGPLLGFRIIELAGIGPGPLAGQLLGDLGADVISIDRRAEPADGARPADANRRGKRSIALDLKRPDGIEAALKLCEGAAAIFEGFRPGVAERLGLGPEACLARNPRLVYGRLTGWGQTGPLSLRAGHDINYIALSGALAATGPAERPAPPLNLVGDYAGGTLFLIMGMLAALLEAQRSGKGQVVDAAMTEGSAAIMSLFHGFAHTGFWNPAAREANIIDGGAPFYRCYETSDGGFMAVGAIEPQFYAALLTGLGLEAELAASQYDRAEWPAAEARFADVFRTRTRDEWTSVFEATDACVAPVLTLTEAPRHKHNVARGAFIEADGFVQPAPAPRFSRTAPDAPRPAFRAGEHGAAILGEAGYDAVAIAALRASGALLEPGS